MPTMRVALGMALGSALVGVAIGWAARPADAGWYGAGLSGSATDCAPLAPSLAVAQSLLSPAEPGAPQVQEWWLRRDQSGAVVEVVHPQGGHRLRLQQEEATGQWRPAACVAAR